jgi:hypothetical protein
MSVLLIADPQPAAPFAEALRAAGPEIDLRIWHPELDAPQFETVEAVLAWRFPPFAGPSVHATHTFTFTRAPR